MLRTPSVVALAVLAACQPTFATRQPPKTDDSGTVTTDDPPTTEPTEPTGPTDPTVTTPTEPTTTPPGGDAFAAVPAPPELDPSALAELADAIDAIRASTVATTGVYAIDAENGQVVAAFEEDDPKKPASNTKLFTTGLAFDLLGQDHRLEMVAYGDAAPSAQGVVDELRVVGHHDFTTSTYFFDDSAFPADRLAEQLYDAGVRSVGDLVVAGDWLIEGYQFGYYDAAGARVDAEAVLFSALEGRGIAVGASSNTSSFTSGAVEIARHLSPPLATACHPLNVYSHNEFADLLQRHNGEELGNGSTYDEGAAAVADWLDGVGVDITGFELHDGSGLSHDNRVTPRQVVDLQAHVADGPAWLAWTRTFSIGGVIGTLGSRFADADVNGRFYGKSGTLTGVIATSGVLFHRHDGHRYFVSVLMNDVADDSYARSLQDDIVTEIGRDRRGRGDRPGKVELRSALSLGDGRVAIAWDALPGVDTYDVWLSRDGLVWDRADARRITGLTTHVAAGLEPDRTWYVQVRAVTDAGWGVPSEILATSTRAEAARVLLVDGNDRWMEQGENPLAYGHDFLVAHASALGSRAVDSVAHELVGSGEVDPADYDLVIWELGEESSDDETFDDAEQDAVSAAVGGGTSLFVSGAELLWDLDWLGAASDRDFAADVLHAAYVGDDAATWTVEPVAGGLFDGLGDLGFYTPGTLEVLFADQLSPVGGTAELRYVGGNGGTAAVSATIGSARVVVFGFPFETIDNGPDREAVMARILDAVGL